MSTQQNSVDLQAINVDVEPTLRYIVCRLTASLGTTESQTMAHTVAQTMKCCNNDQDHSNLDNIDDNRNTHITRKH